MSVEPRSRRHCILPNRLYGMTVTKVCEKPLEMELPFAKTTVAHMPTNAVYTYTEEV